MSCSTGMRAFALFSLMEYDVLFPSISVNSLITVFIETSSLFTIISAALLRERSFLSGVWFLVSVPTSACVMKNCSSSPTSEEGVVNSIGVLCMCFQILRRMFSITLCSSLARKSAAVMIEATNVCFFRKKTCNTKSHAFNSDGGKTFVWKKRLDDLLSIRTSARFAASLKRLVTCKKAFQIAKKLLE